MAVDKAKSKSKKTQKPKGKPSRRAKPTQELLDLKAQGDQAREAYNYPAAVEAYTRALDLGKAKKDLLDAVTEYEILSGRATCSEYLGDVVSEVADLESMAALAKKMNDLHRRIEVVIRQQRPMDQLGRANEVLRSAEQLADLARKSGDRQLLADGLRALARAYSSEGIQDAPNFALYCEQARELYRELEDRRGEAFCLLGLGQTEAFVGHVEQARDHCSQALDLFRTVGDRKMESETLSFLGIYATDQASRRDRYEASLAIAHAVASRPNVAALLNNLALLYASLGLYDTARHHIEESVAAVRGMGARGNLGTFLESLGRILLKQGDLEAAMDAFTECLTLAVEVGSRYVEGYAELGLGQVLIASGQIKEGVKHLQAGRKRFEELSNAPEIAAACSFLAQGQLAMEEVDRALNSTAEAVEAVKSTGEASTDYPPQLTWWTRYRALREADNPSVSKTTEEDTGKPDVGEAWKALQHAHDLTMADIERLSDQGLRRNYLNKVELNREIHLEWTKEARARGVWQPEEAERQGNLQQQLKRMLAIGLRLNERRTTNRLTEFIMEQFVELSGAERTGLILTDESGARNLVSDRGFPSESRQALIDHLGLLFDEAAASQHAVIKQNVSRDDPSEPSGGFMDAVSVLCLPLIAHGQLLGMLYGDNHAVFGRFGDADVDLLSAFANQAAAAIENSRLYQGLEDRVAERTSELNEANASLEHRAAELSVINSVQQGLASKLDFEKIIELVGNKIQEVFKSQGIAVRIYDPETDLVHYPYEVEQGERLPAYPPRPPSGVSGHVIRTRQPLRINEDMEGWMERLGASILPGSRTNKSLLAVPVIVKDEVRGTVQMEDDQEDAYNEADERLLSTIAASMGVALENARLFDETARLLEETRQRNAELAVINSVQAGLASKLDLAGIVEVVGDKVAEILQTRDMTIRLLNEDGNLLITPYYLEHGDRFPVDPVSVEKIPIPAKALKTGKPVIAFREELEAAAHGGAATIGDPDSPMPASILYLPFMSGDKPRGLISVADVEREDAYGEPEIRLLTTLANSMSVALENARLFEQTNHLLEETRQRNAELAVINRVQEGLASKLDFQAIIDLVGDEIYTIFPNESIGIALFEGDPLQMYFRYWRISGKQRRDEIPPRSPVGFSRQVLQTGRTVVHNHNVSEAAAEVGSGLVVDDVETPKSVIFVPLRLEGEVRGVISLQNLEAEGVYNEPQVRLLESLASSLSVALENARLFDETTRLLDETRQRNAELAVINKVQEGLASKLDLSAIVEVVGDEISKILDSGDLSIRILDDDGSQLITPYLLEHGQRFPADPAPFEATHFAAQVIQGQRPIVVGWEEIKGSVTEGAGTMGDPDSPLPKSMLVVPLLSRGKGVGVIQVADKDNENAYGETEISLVTTLANSMSVALENARLFDETSQLLDETRQRNAELAVINSVQQGLASKLDLAGVVEVVGEEIAKIFAGHDVKISLLSEDGSTLITPYLLEHGERFPVDPSPVGSAFFSGRVLRSRKPLLLGPADFEEGLAKGVMTVGDPDSGFPKSELRLPILSADKALGVITLGHREREDAYGESEINLLTTLANSMSVALENARLFDETSHLLEETRRRNAELAVINSVGEALAAKLEIQAIYDAVGDKLHEIFPEAQVVDILSYDLTQDLFTPHYVLEREKRFEVEPWKPKGFRKHVVETGQPLVINEDMEEMMKEYDHATIVGEAAKSWVGVPMKSGDRVIGVISLQHLDKEHAFSDSDVSLLQTLASSMSVALENARLFEETNRLLDETRQRNAELAVINSVQEGLANELDMVAIFNLVGEEIREIFDAQVVDILTYDAETNLCTYQYNFEKGQQYDIQPFAPAGFSGQILKTRKPLMFNEDLETHMAELGSQVLGESETPKAYLGVPLIRSDGAFGVISLQNVDRENAFSESDLRLLMTLASSMSVALENARLFDETNRLLEESRQHNLELAAINTVSQALVAESELDKLINLVGEQVRETFDADIAYVALYDEKTNMINFPYLYGEGEVESIPFGSGMSSQVIRMGEPLLLNRDLDDAAAKMETERRGTRAKSYLGVPIKLGGQTIGVVSVQSTQEQDRFDETDVRLLETIAANAGAAIGSARLYEETKQRASELAAINVIGEGLLSQMDLERVVELVGESFSDIFEADDFGIGLYDRQSQKIRVLYDLHLGERMPSNDVPYGQGLTSIVLETHRPLMLNTWEDMVKQGTVILNPELVEGEIRNASWLGVPIMSGADITGAMFCTRYRDHAFDDADLRLLSTIAANMGVAIRNARLYEETKQRASELAAINVIGEALLSQMDLDRVIELVGDNISEIFESNQIGIAICDYEANKIRLPFFLEHGKRLPEIEIEMGEGLVSAVIESRQPLNLNNWEELRQHDVVMHPDAKDPLPEENSWLGVPIMSGTEVNGVIFSNANRADAFSDSDQRLLSTIAANMGVAIRNAQLYTETQRRAEEMAALNEIGKEASATLDLPTVLARISSNAGRLLSAHTTAVILVDEDGVNLRAAAAQGDMEQEVKDFTWRIGQGLIGGIVESGGAERVNNTAEDPRTIELPGTEKTVEGEKLLVAPLISRERAVGALAAWRDVDDPAFSQDDLSFSEGLAQQAAIAIQNAQLFEEAERRAGQMAALNELGREISATLDLETVLNRIAAQSRELLSGDTSAVFMLQPDDKTLRVIAADGEIADEVRAMTAEIGLGMVGSIAESGKAEVINDVSADSRSVHIPGTSNETQNQKLMAAPLLTKDAVLGVMAIWRGAESPAFTQADLIFLAGLARQATVAIENARLFNETQRQRDYSGALVENSPVAIVTTDLDGNVVSWNPAAERLFAYPAEEAIGQNIDRLISNEALRQEAVEYTDQVFNQGRVNAVTRRVRKDGSEIDVELLALPVSVNGTHTGLIAIYHDITELLQAQREAETANQAKSAFLATMSHEIRTPMNAVIGMSGLLLDTELDPEQHEFAEIIRNSGDALLAIINDVLDFSKIEAGKMDLESQPFDLRECIEGTLDLVATKAGEKGLDLAYVIEDGIPAGIVGDVTRLRQILLNLLTNSVKFTEEGEVVLTVQPQQEAPKSNGDAPAQPMLHFTVHDTGIGIPAERMDRLFQSFSQVDASTARKYGGTGLGLAISRRLSEMMGGTMWVESKLGVGTSFHFTIRAEASDDIAPSSRRMKLSDPNLQGRRVLIVDDNDTNRRILTLQTERWGMIPRDTGSPKTVLGWIRKGDPFDIAILDMHMPEMDGLTLASEIRQHRAADVLPLILFTSLGRRETGAEELDFAAFLTKPIKPSHLFDSLVSIFADQPVAVRQPSSSAQMLDPEMALRHPLRILLAEDNAVNQKLAVRLLAQMGYRTDIAANGLEAIESIERQTYDIVLMDVQMPEMDGLEASRQITTRWPADERPRIVAMTANAMQGDRELCIAAGMDDYITKPIRVGELVAALEKAPATRSQEGHA